MRRVWRFTLVALILTLALMFSVVPFSQTEERNPDYTYRYGCPVWEEEEKSYCPERYQSLKTAKSSYSKGEEVRITLANLKDFEYKVNKVEIHLKPQFEHDFNLVYTEKDLAAIPRSEDEWTWGWDQRNAAGELVESGRAYVRVTFDCCKNYRVYFRINGGGEEVEIPSEPEEPEEVVEEVRLSSSPGGLTTQALSSREVRLTWNDNSDNEDGFRIYRNGNEIATVGANVTSYTDTGLEEGRSYTYRVASFNEAGESSLSGSSQIMTTTTVDIPVSPGKLSTQVLSSREIRLTWTDNSEVEDGFRIYRNGNEIATVGANVTSYTDTGLEEGRSYTYRVASFNEAGESSMSGSRTVRIPYEVPDYPGSLSSKVLSPYKVRLTWNDSSDNEDGFRIYRNGTEIAEVGANVTSYTDTGLKGETDYTYRVSSYNEGGESSLTDGLQVTTPVEVSSAPGNLTSEILSPTEVRLTWNDNSDNEDGFRIYRDGNRVVEVGPNTTSYVDTGLNENTRYTYRVSSYNEAGESSRTSRLNVTTPVKVPASPGQLQAETVSNSEIELTWNDDSDNEDGFRIYRDGNRVATVEPNTTSYLHEDLSGETRYCYEVVAFNDSGESKPTNRNCSMTLLSLPDSPRNLKATLISDSEIELTWNDDSDNEDGFRIYRDGVEIATLGQNTTSYTDRGLDPNSSYSYEVSAYNSSGESGLSSSETVTTPVAEEPEPEPEPEPDTGEEGPPISQPQLLAGVGVVLMVMGYIYAEMG